MKITIKRKLVFLGTVLTTIPAIIISVTLSHIAIKNAEESALMGVENKLTVVRETTAEHISTYFQFIKDQMITFSSDRMTQQAMLRFTSSYNDYAAQLDKSDLAAKREQLSNYYKNEYDKKFQKLNNGNSANPSGLLANIDDAGISLQYEYISNNPAKLGEKDKLLAAPTPTSYNLNHKNFHPSINQYQQQFGYYDIFLVDAQTGVIVYSVFKELDYATSLKTGPYANSGIGEAYRKALNLKKGQDPYLTDFKPYLPSYDSAASFISSPIFQGDKLIGVAIFQMPVDRINSVMTHHKHWQTVGLGDSGETYLVGEDFTMRSEGRFLIEDKTNYIQLMKELGTANNIVSLLDAKQTTIGLQQVKTKGTEAALNGAAGFDLFPDYRGVPVFSSYKPIQLLGLKWAVMSEIDEAEAFADIAILKKQIIINALIIIVIAIFAGAILGWLFATIIIKPVATITNMVDNIAKGEGDLTKRIDIGGSNEITFLSLKINSFINHLDETFAALLKSLVRLVPVSKELAVSNSDLTESLTKQKQQADLVNDCLTNANESTMVVNNQLTEINEATEQGNVAVDACDDSVQLTATNIETLSNTIEEAVEGINTLKGDTDKISKIVDVINSISEQTNLLALNAAIEAARAGDAGRGFAVVASEVRDLAQKTKLSTQEVSNMVNTIQASTLNVVNLMHSGKDNADKSSTQIIETTEKLQSAKGAMAMISGRVTEIDEAISVQETNFNEVTERYKEMEIIFGEAQEHSETAARIGTDIDKLGSKLMEMVKRYKVSDGEFCTRARTEIRE